jgi:hypothetical protein
MGQCATESRAEYSKTRKVRVHYPLLCKLKQTECPSSALFVIYEHMKREAEANWRSRLMRKSEIEAALGDYHTLLDDAARSFQVCVTWEAYIWLTLKDDFAQIGSLIDIHYTLHQTKLEKLSVDNKKDVELGYEVIHTPATDTLPRYNKVCRLLIYQVVIVK